MELGIFAKTFPRPTLEQTLDAVVSHGLTHIQFNMSCMGLATLPDKLDEGSCVWIAQTLHERGLSMAAISGTFNMVDPNASRLGHNLRRLEVLAEACRWLDTRIITLCTGSLDPHDMWKWHPENARKSTWERLVETMRAAVAIADRHEVTLAFEPEINNVVSSVIKARLLLDEIGSPWLKVVIDPANLVHPESPNPLVPTLDTAKLFGVWSAAGAVFEYQGRPVASLDEAFDWLGQEIVLAHAKNPPWIDEAFDLSELEATVRGWQGSTAIDRQRDELLAKLATEEGRWEFRRRLSWWPFYQPYLTCLDRVGFRGALIMHGLNEDQVTLRTSFLREMLESLSRKQD
jgi:sugar phosphate isomerase/epimerase